MDQDILVAAVRRLVIHVAEEANVDFNYALEQVQFVCQELAARGDKSITGRNLVALAVARIRKEQQSNNQQGGH